LHALSAEKMEEEQLIKELKKLGWRYCYYGGHGEVEPVIDGDFVVGDIEKSSILVPPDCIWKDPIKYVDYF